MRFCSNNNTFTVAPAQKFVVLGYIHVKIHVPTRVVYAIPTIYVFIPCSHQSPLCQVVSLISRWQQSVKFLIFLIFIWHWTQPQLRIILFEDNTVSLSCKIVVPVKLKNQVENDVKTRFNYRTGVSKNSTILQSGRCKNQH